MATRKIVDSARLAMAGIVADFSKSCIKNNELIDNIYNQAKSLKVWYRRARTYSMVDSLNYYRTSLQNQLVKLENYTADLDNSLRNPVAIETALQELMALEAMFPRKVTYLCRQKTIKVVTDPIELTNSEEKTIKLGCFTMALKLQPKKSLGLILRAIPKTPNFAYDTHVSHPHVSGNNICFGVAKEAITNSLRQGRISDLFELLNGLLHNYNEGAGFAEICDWEGNEHLCASCGSSDRDIELFYCDCDRPYCRECSTGCLRCGYRMCHDCASTCSLCENTYCGACSVLHPCSECGYSICQGCSVKCSSCSRSICVNCAEKNSQCVWCRNAGVTPPVASDVRDLRDGLVYSDMSFEGLLASIREMSGLTGLSSLATPSAVLLADVPAVTPVVTAVTPLTPLTPL